MTRDIEDLIRSAQEIQADRALPADRIRAALPQRAATVRRRQRFGMLGAAVAAAAVAAAVAVPALVLRGPEPATTSTVAAAPSTAPADPSPSATTAGLPAQVALGYKPTWAPPGLSEHIRQYGTAEAGDPFGPTLMRFWTKQVGTGDPQSADGPQLLLYVRTQVSGEGRLAPDGGKKVDVNGAPGYYHDDGGKSYVDWAINEHTVLSLATVHYDLGKADLLRMARSVRPDPGVTATPLTLRWLPEGWSSNFVTVSGDTEQTWRASVLAGKVVPATGHDKNGKDKKAGADGQLSVTVGSGTDAPDGGEKLTVGGHPARHPKRSEPFAQSMLYLVVDLGGGRQMTLIGEGAGITLDDLTKIAEQAEISKSAPDWIG
ncbi:hypothetical protein GCM10010168_62910 [Actinoplanes ianthinogenes]|uniref:DUF4367 domain-containing protein n=1 Tax=Actinoplanes ianthinogenes TaxID=122358 RepID=A0ABM7LJN3_9ACTN|nr:hypothetical protein [Actinoplanes ianthinogenes]BCJ39461.1 hypothetical protein Aiant_01180 [Actinoplanes ianthinogenes]GGR35939.1 hypothetical protein GCM10010168_62910 [Actinoplanes ianthinogenes]